LLNSIDEDSFDEDFSDELENTETVEETFNEEEIVLDENVELESVDTIVENSHSAAKKTNDEINNIIEIMRAEHKKPSEITKEYLRIENCNVVNFKQKILCEVI
jgi:CHASE3 domain sensor protein